MRHRWNNLLIGLLFSLCFTFFAYAYLNFPQKLSTLKVIDYRYNDIKYKFMGEKKFSPDAVLVAIDDDSLKEIGRWPWPRDTMMLLQEQLVQNGVKSIGMDIIQSEPDLFFPEKDKTLVSSLEKNADKIILGTFSNNQLLQSPYQDYCVNEAFLYTGGADLVKLNPTFVVDDDETSFDEIDWQKPLKIIFQFIEKKTESAFLIEKGKASFSHLNQYQKNSLAAKKNSEIFNYCSRWLTTNDEIFSEHKDKLLPLYDEIFQSTFVSDNIATQDKMHRFKSSVEHLPFPLYGEWQGNFPELQKTAQHTGSFVTQLDGDGYVRHYPLFYRSGNKMGTSYIPSLALQTYLVATGYRADVRIEKVGEKKAITSFTIIDPSKEPEEIVGKIPTDESGQLLINYYGPANTLPHVSAKDLLATDDEFIDVFTREDLSTHSSQVFIKKERLKKKDFLKGKSALLGVTSMAIYDLRNTPVDKNYPGPEIHLTVLNNLLQQNFTHYPPAQKWVLPVMLLALGASMSLLLTFLGALPSLISMIVCSFGFFYIDLLIFQRMHIAYSSVLVLTEIIGLHFFIFIYKYFSEEKKKIELRRTFSKYVSPAVVDELLKADENLKIGGKKQVLSVFFSDLRGFTDLSEKMDPSQLSQFLNEYLTPMTNIIFKNRGTLDKYMGDGVMAFFGAPVEDKDHAYHACKCALESIQALDQLRIEFAKKGWPPIDLGIGINTGPMSVGNMGSESIQSYTVIGDAVNLGARLESANKDFGTQILVSEYTYELAKDHFPFREVGRIAVKGKTQPVRTYELLTQKSNAQLTDWLDLYHKAYGLYMDKEFQKAHDLFVQAEKLKSQDKVTSIYKQRCTEYIQSPPNSSWDGVDRRKHK